MNEQQKKAVAEAAKLAGTPGNRAFAEIMLEVVQPQHLSLDLFQAFLPVRQFNAGDEVVKRVRRGRYPVRTFVPGSMHLTDVTDFQEKMTYAFERLVAGTSHSLWEIQSGEVGTTQQMRTDLRADIFDAIVSKVFNLLTTVWTEANAGDNYTDASSGGVTATVLDAMIETVLNNTGNVRSIVGSRRALLPVYDFAQYREFVLGGTGTDRVGFPTAAFDEFVRTGRVSTYRGIPLVELPQIQESRLPDIKRNMIPTDKVLVIGDTAGEIGIQGETQFQDYTDYRTQPANYVLHAWQGFSMMIDNVEGLGIIKSNT